MSQQIANYCNETPTLGRMLLGIQNDRRLAKGAQIAHDLAVRALPKLAMRWDRLLQLQFSDTAIC